jgi:hypothetical protein
VLPTGQTVGMTIVGIKLRRSDGSDEFSAIQAAIRTALLPLSLSVVPLPGLIGLFRRDGRMLPDIVAGTGLVYSWDARMSKARLSAETRMQQMQRQDSFSEEESSRSEADSQTPLLVEVDFEATIATSLRQQKDAFRATGIED